jgi:hypothetical protein
VRGALGTIKPIDSSNLLVEKLSKTDYNLFRGDIAQGSLMFHAPAESDGHFEKPTVCLDCAILVEDSMKDRYPLWITLFYDKTRSRFWIYAVSRTVSLRITDKPKLVF